MIHITLTGVPPPKKNSRRIFAHSGKIVNIPSERYKAWHDRVWMELPSKGVETKRCQILVAYWMPDDRARDLTNITESVMDLLVDRQLIQDDRWQVVKRVTMCAMGIDREKPRTEVEIYGLSP